jgi:hypothetical protein
MSEFRVDQITNQSGSRGPDIAGITTFSATSGMVMPSGDVLGRYGIDNFATKDLILYLDGGEIGGNLWPDLSGNGNDFLLYNSPTTNGTALTFNGTNQYARSKNIINFNRYDCVTIDIGFKKTTRSGTMLLELTSNWNSNSGAFGVNPNSTGFAQSDFIHHTVYSVPGGVGAVGKNYRFDFGLNWTIQTFLFSKIVDPEGRSVYVNSNPVDFDGGIFDTTKATIASTFANDYLYIASRGGTGSFNDVSIGHIIVYGAKKTSQEIQQNYNALRGRYGL